MSNMNLWNACNIQYYESLFMSNLIFLCPTWIYRMNVIFSVMSFHSYVQDTNLCPTWIYEMHATFSIMHFYFMYTILFYVQHMCNLPFYVQHKSTKYLWHSVLWVFILMSNILFYVQHESTKCMRHSVWYDFILYPTYYFVSNICSTYHFMSNRNLQNAYNIQCY